jgi:pyruvate, water dikinase
MNRKKLEMVGSGILPLDELLQGLRPGDNVVWQVDSLDDYIYFVQPFINQSLKDGLKCAYLRFASHKPVLRPQKGLKIIELDPSPGFDYFSTAVHRIIEENGKDVCYVFDNISSLVAKWATDELLANFFQVTCPYLFELDTVTYFALTRNQHSHSTVARIRDTTQILLDLYHVQGQVYIHPLKVWDRYSAQMFLPHVVSGELWSPVFGSGDAAAVSSTASQRPLKNVFSASAPWDSVYSKLIQYQNTDLDLTEEAKEVTALKQELTRMMIGNHPEFNKVADRFLTIKDLMRIRDRLIGSGRIGGKSAGMLVARQVLLQDKGPIDFAAILEEHDSFYIGSDVFFTFLVNNNLFRLRIQLSKNAQISHEEFEVVEKQFLDGQFPVGIVDQFKDMLEYFGQAPIIVRSSSLLEDSFGNAFAGKYRSEFCANQGSPETRLENFLKAVKLVYASALNPDALVYRRKRGLGENDEQMAILVQRVSGKPYRNYFFPTLAGVGFSKNLYAWSDRIDPQQGMLRLVLGLGTRAVNRVGGDYPRMIAVSNPDLRPEIGTKIAKYSQKNIDLLDLSANEFATLQSPDVLSKGDYPDLHLLVSSFKDGYLQDPLFRSFETSSDGMIITFNNLLKQTKFVQIMGGLLSRLENAWGQPVDTEFTAHIKENGEVRINLLQCRPLRVPKTKEALLVLPENLSADKILFRSDRTVSGGTLDSIQYIIYIDPGKYSEIASMSLKRSVGRAMGKLNEYFRNTSSKVMAMGPGRWGSSNIDLGVNVSYSDIDNVSVLVEVAREKAGHEPEVSYGTHFFQDLVEADIIYLPVYPDKVATEFNKRFFSKSHNSFNELLPEYAELADVIRVIDVPTVSRGQFVHVIADPQTRKAVCYLK